MPADRLSATEMRDLVRSGAARPLMAGFEVVPTSFDGAWWHVPQEAEDDVFVRADPELSAELDRLRTRADQADAMLGSDGTDSAEPR